MKIRQVDKENITERSMIITANRVTLACGMQMLEHLHVCHQLYYIFGGAPVFEIDGKTLRAGTGTCFCIPPRKPHRMLPLQDSALSCLEFKLQVDDPFLASHLESSSLMMQDQGGIRRLLLYVYDNWRSRDPQNIRNNNTILTTLLMDFFLEEMHYSPDDSCRIRTEGYNPPTRAAMAYIEQQYQNPFSLEELSRELHYNRNYLSSVFSRDTGITVVDYLHLIRIRQAVLMIAFYAQDVFTACESVGFTDPAYFSRVFKRLTGVPARSFKFVFSKTDRKKLGQLFTDEVILNLQVASLEEEMASLKSLGNSVRELARQET